MENLYILGAGFVGQTVLNRLLPLYEKQYQHVYFGENDPDKVGTVISGVPVVYINDIYCNENETISIIIAADHWKEIYEQCINLNIADYIEAIWNGSSLRAFKYLNYSVSQDGEDIILSDIFKDNEQGFYVDIGAHHPIRISNTFWAYKKGWRGLNVEPNEIQIGLFELLRDRDINVQMGCAGKEGVLKYYKYSEPAFNSFNEDAYKDLVPIAIVDIKVKPLSEILDEYSVGEVDLLSIDTEGTELEVLKSNDWNRWIPKVIIVEQEEDDVEEVIQSEICVYLKDKGYVLKNRTRMNSIYVLKGR